MRYIGKLLRLSNGRHVVSILQGSVFLVKDPVDDRAQFISFVPMKEIATDVKMVPATPFLLRTFKHLK